MEKASKQAAKGQRKGATRQDGNSSTLDTSRRAGQTAVGHHDVTGGIDNDDDCNDSVADAVSARGVHRTPSQDKKNQFSPGNLRDKHIERITRDANGPEHLSNQRYKHIA